MRAKRGVHATGRSARAGHGGCYYDPEAWQPPFHDRRCLEPAGFDGGDTRRIESFHPEKISEYVRHAWYSDPGRPLHPWDSRTEAARGAGGRGYSYAKATRYDDRVVQLGPWSTWSSPAIRSSPRYSRPRGPNTWFDAGTAGLNALPLFEGCSNAVLVDAVKLGATIGRVHRLSLNDYVPEAAQRGMHGSGVESLLAALPTAFAQGTRPEVVLIEVEIGHIVPFTTMLSPPVAAATSQTVKLTMLECTNQVSVLFTSKHACPRW